MFPLRWQVLLLMLLAAAAARPGSATLTPERAAPLVAVFPLEVVDTSGEPPNAQWPARIATVTHLFSERLAASGKYRAVELPAADPDRPLYQCAACWRVPAQTAGADTAAITAVHKVSTLIASLHVWLIDVETQKLSWQGAVSLRGDTDEAWRRAMDYILRRGILSPEPGRQMLSSPFPGG